MQSTVESVVHRDDRQSLAGICQEITSRLLGYVDRRYDFPIGSSEVSMEVSIILSSVHIQGSIADYSNCCIMSD